MKYFVSFLLITIYASMIGGAVYASPDEDVAGTVILSSQDDPYFILAEEMAQTEGISITNTFDEAAEADPVFLLWVVAPENLSESVLMDFSAKLNELGAAISVGIISGKTIEGLYNKLPVLSGKAKPTSGVDAE